MAMGVTVAPRAFAGPQLRVFAGLGVLLAASLVLRTGVLGSGYWTDESIAIGIASRPLGEIPATLRLDGSPPLYYLLLHGWMALFGTAEVATRAMSLVWALLAIPVAWWAARAASGADRTAWLAAGAAALMPFLTQYGQETRMYAMVVVLSLAATGCFAVTLRTGRLLPAVGLAAFCVALLYTHNWGVFLVAGFVAAWVWEWRHGRASWRLGLGIGVAVFVAWLPWLPSMIFQAQHTGAPWAATPPIVALLAAPFVFGGAIGGPVLLVAVAVAELRKRRLAEAELVVREPGVTAGLLLGIGVIACTIAWAMSQLEPAWALRYLAVTAGPLVIGSAMALRRTPWLPLVILVVGVAWVAWTPEAERSNVRTLARELTPQLKRDDAVIVTAPQHVPVIANYLPAGLHWFSTDGALTDTAVVDWRDLIDRIDATPAASLARDAVADVPLGGRVVMFAPFERRASTAPLREITRTRTVQLTELLDRDPRLRRLQAPSTSLVDQRSSLRVSVWQRVVPGT